MADNWDAESALIFVSGRDPGAVADAVRTFFRGHPPPQHCVTFVSEARTERSPAHPGLQWTAISVDGPDGEWLSRHLATEVVVARSGRSGEWSCTGYRDGVRFMREERRRVEEPHIHLDKHLQRHGVPFGVREFSSAWLRLDFHAGTGREFSHHTFEVLPGEGIGPFRLGMSRLEVAGAAQRVLGIELRGASDATRDDSGWIGDTGLRVSYDASGRCESIEASLGLPFPESRNRSAFLLFGRNIASIADEELIRLCRERWPDAEDHPLFGLEVPSAGLSSSYWDSRSDGFGFCAFWVRRPRTSGAAGSG
jgi:hypothetical protein